MNLKFRKKPVVIEAFQMTAEHRLDNAEWPDWLNRAWQLEPGTPGALSPASNGVTSGVDLVIGTLEGNLLLTIDDWIIQGVQGEIYPCKPAIFEATYEAVTE